jgi:transcriptional regulator with XRE-family HTH domain
MLDEFSKELKQAREKNGISLQQIAQKSRIDLKFIEALDRGDFGFLPELYVKAFIKQYARIVGLDENATITKYEAAKQGKTTRELTLEPSEESVIKEHKSTKEKPRPKSNHHHSIKTFEDNVQKDIESEPANFIERLKTDKILLGSVIAGIAVVLFVIIYFFFIKSNSNIVVAEKPYDEIRRENQQRYLKENKPVVNDKLVEPVKIDSLTLVVQAVDSAWFHIRVDNSEILDFVLFPYAKRTIKAATGFKMTIGNAGDTRLTLDNKNLELSGKKKEVKYVFVDKNGIKYLQTPPNTDQK